MLMPSDQIRAIAPGMSSVECEVIDEALHAIEGGVEVLTQDGIILGNTNHRAPSVATVVVELTGIFKGSGGEKYKFTSAHHSGADHYIMTDTPDVTT
jgi:hypothetical protein